MATRRKKNSGGINPQSAFLVVGGVLIGLVIGVPVLAAIFADGGPFAALVSIPTDGALAGNAYSGILTAIIALIPLLVVGFFAFRYFSSGGGSGMMSRFRGGGKKRRKSTRRSPRRRASTRNRPPTARQIQAAQALLARAEAARAARGPAV